MSDEYRQEEQEHRNIIQDDEPIKASDGNQDNGPGKASDGNQDNGPGRMSAGRQEQRPSGKREDHTRSYAALLEEHRRRKRRRRLRAAFFLVEFLAAGGLLAAAYFLFVRPNLAFLSREGISSDAAVVLYQNLLAEGDRLAAEEAERAKETEEPDFEPYCTAATAPENLISSTEIEINGEAADSSQYASDAAISFGSGAAYTDVSGIVTFRGNNFRNTASYGTAEITEGAMSSVWSAQTGGLSYKGASWSGSGWTGQPLIAKWPKETKAAMNMYDWAKEEDDLAEVIYACMDGYIYFLSLKDGQATRDPLYLGYTFKGAGALDPRGYPILYVGAGYDSNEGTARAFIISLIDCSVLYTFGNNDPFSLRGTLSYFDSSALVDAETDTLIYPGENGILYLIRLNTDYNEAKGTLTIDPDPVVKWRYYGTRSSTASYWVGMESSAAIYKGYLFIADNGGNLMCLDLNTLTLIWVQDILDDSNSTPVLAVEDSRLYLYVSTSFHLGWRSSDTASVPIWKIDAENGEVVWQTEYECYTDDGVSGGVQSTIAVGRKSLSDYIYVTVSKTGSRYGGVLACLDRRTGEAVWEHSAYYAWSSPVCVYNSDGSGYVLYCTCEGNLYLINALTGDVLYTLAISDGAVEASPAVYDDMLVIGTRACKIWGIRLE